MGKKVSEPYAPQANKPLTKYVNDIIGELTSTYIQIPRYHSKQRILIPIMDSDDERADEPKEKDAAEKTERSSTNQSITQLPAEESPLPEPSLHNSVHEEPETSE